MLAGVYNLCTVGDDTCVGGTDDRIKENEMSKTTFVKSNGGYLFRTTDGEVYRAVRNEAGFAGRDWELWTVDGRLAQDQLSSRGECVELAQGLADDRAKLEAYAASL